MQLEGVEGRCFYLEEEGLPAYDELIYVANSEKLNSDKILRFLEAVELATQYVSIIHKIAGKYLLAHLAN